MVRICKGKMRVNCPSLCLYSSDIKNQRNSYHVIANFERNLTTACLPAMMWKASENCGSGVFNLRHFLLKWAWTYTLSESDFVAVAVAVRQVIVYTIFN